MKQKTKSKSKKQAEKTDVLGRVVHTVLTILFLVVVVVMMLVLTRQLYQFGYDIFGENRGPV